MSIFTNVVFAVMVVGGCLLLVSLVWLICSVRRKQKDGQHADTVMQTWEERVLQADQLLDELNKTAKSIFEELEEKHQEMLTLYYMVEDRKKEMMGERPEAPVKEKEKEKEKNLLQPGADPKANPKMGKIRAMHDKGMSEEQIAKTLGIGQGEVKLILNLGKGK